jgi:hypothetical protein
LLKAQEVFQRLLASTEDKRLLMSNLMLVFDKEWFLSKITFSGKYTLVV